MGWEAGRPLPAPGGALVEIDPLPADAAARDEVKTYLRIEDDGDDALVDRLVAVAIAHGEAFTGRLWLIRAVEETVPACGEWRRLGCTPVRSITSVAALPGDGGDPVTLAVDAYAIDIDAAGDGWVRTIDAGSAARLRLSYQAGLAAGWASLPEPLRQGAVRLASHFYARRDDPDEGAPPAAAAALWRPWRRMRVL